MDSLSSDLESYRQPWESEEHWELRKEFLEVHAGKFPEDRLLCLAQVYTNVELLGCKYPDGVMIHVCELAKDMKIAEKIRDERQNRAAIKFVKAQEEKQKKKRGGKQYSNFSNQSRFGRPWDNSNRGHSSYNRSPYDRNANFHDRQPQYDSGTPSYYSSRGGRQGEMLPFSPTTPKLDHIGGGERGHQQQGRPFNPRGNSLPLQNPLANRSPRSEALVQKDVQFRRLSEMVRSESGNQPNELQLMQVCTSKLYMKCLWTFDTVPEGPGGSSNRNPTFICRLFVDGILTGMAKEISKKSAKSAAYANAVHRLVHPPIWVEQSLGGAIELFSTNNTVPSCPISIEPRPALREGKLDNTLEQVQQPNSNLPLHNLLIINDMDANEGFSSEISVVMNTASFNRINCNFKFDTVMRNKQQLLRCEVKIGDEQVGEGFGENKHLAKLEACKVALANLQKVAYTVKMKQRVCDGGQQISKDQLINVDGGKKQNSITPLSSDNLGFKMLQMMGWTGGGVGKEGNTGITEPVSLKDVYRRVGLGYSNDRNITKEFNASVHAIVSEFAQSGSTSDLAFSPEFSKEERKKIHNIAQKYHLKSISRGGRGTERHIVLSHRFNPQQLLHHMLEVGGATDKYELIHPSSTM